MHLLDLGRDLKDTVADGLVGLDVAVAVDDDRRTRPAVPVEERNLRVRLERFGEAAFGVAEPCGNLRGTKDLEASPQRQLRFAVRVDVGEDDGRAVCERAVEEAARRERDLLLRLWSGIRAGSFEDGLDLVFVVETERDRHAGRSSPERGELGYDDDLIAVRDRIAPASHEVDRGVRPQSRDVCEDGVVALQLAVARGEDHVAREVRGGPLRRGTFAGAQCPDVALRGLDAILLRQTGSS